MNTTENKSAGALSFQTAKELLELQEHDSKHFPFQTYFSFGPLIKYLKEQRAHLGLGSKLVVDAIFERINANPELKQPTRDFSQIVQQEELLNLIMDGFLPFFHPSKDQMGYIVAPFSPEQLFSTKAFHQIAYSEDQEIQIKGNEEGELIMQLPLNACRLILSRFYNKSFDPNIPSIITIRNKQTRLEKHYRINLILDFVEALPIKPLKKIDARKIIELINNPQNLQLWLEQFPPDRFKFEGLVIIYLTERTDEEIISNLNTQLLGPSNVSIEPDISLVESELRSYFRLPNLRLGASPIHNTTLEHAPLKKNSLSLTGTNFVKQDLEQPVYGKVIGNKNIYIIEDIESVHEKTNLHKKLLSKGIRSLILVPILNTAGEIMAILELGNSEANTFNQSHLIKLERLIPLLQTGFNRKLEIIENQIRAITQNEFTSLHSSVRWKFREVAFELMRRQQKTSSENLQVPPIKFSNVYPLYGQSDIVGSSAKRNQAILEDLSNNLELAINTLDEISQQVSSYFIKHLRFNSQQILDEIQDQFNSNDENRILDLLRNDLHPFFQQIAKDYPILAAKVVRVYFNELDPGLGFIYRRRKAFEESVALLNNAISRFLEEEDETMQNNLPHYFEKYSTDGVEYNIYVGQSLLHGQNFSAYKLRDFRIWQLVHMCQITQRVAEFQSKLPEPLTTAQLIFVYSDTLDIRFRMDEKQFDVDGAYNVRYEILKKRIDKAYIEGTSERLTQSGKIAIVYLHTKDQQEYMEYLKFLISKDYILPEVEKLQLGRLQGVEGLRALRVTVKTS